MEHKHVLSVIQHQWLNRFYQKADYFKRVLLLLCCIVVYLNQIKAQKNGSLNNADTLPSFTLKQCIDYSLQHQPSLQQALINISIAKTTNSISLSGRLPQVGITANLTHYFQLPTTLVNQSPVSSGIANTAIPGIGVTQAIFSPSLQYAAKASPLYVKQAEQITDSAKIELVSSVSKSFYSLLLTLEQINVLKEDTIRLAQNVRDSYHQYVGGIVDETDYEEATITLNNSMAQLKQANENVTPQYSILKQLMGFPAEKQFNINFDTALMSKEINIDTAAQLQYENRIELKQLSTTQSLQRQLSDYYRSAALPTLSAFYNYNHEFENKEFSKLFGYAYPNSFIGLTFSVPVFTGFSRVQNLHRSQLLEKELEWSTVGLKSQIFTEYTTALANYKSNLYNMNMLKNNVNLAKRVYFVVTLQYKQGIVAYLNVITAESNLITAEIGYLNALFLVLSSKIDLEKAMGTISY